MGRPLTPWLPAQKTSSGPNLSCPGEVEEIGLTPLPRLQGTVASFIFTGSLGVRVRPFGNNVDPGPCKYTHKDSLCWLVSGEARQHQKMEVEASGFLQRKTRSEPFVPEVTQLRSTNAPTASPSESFLNPTVPPPQPRKCSLSSYCLCQLTPPPAPRPL